MRILITLTMLLCAVTASAADRISNVRASQSGNRAVFEYDLSGDKPAAVNFSVTVKGEKLSADSLHLEGDYGKNVAPGRRKLVWNVLQDYPRGLHTEIDWNLTAGSGLTDPTTGIEFKEVPGGCFNTNGSQVCLDGFSIGKFEVTQGQWKAVMGNNPSRFSSCGDDCPVETVSWDDVQEFIRKLNSRSARNYRLPTEAEWEYACRSGGKNEEYCGGNDVDAVAWYGKNSGSKTHQVGQKQPNGLGIHDLSGNVWEWCGDWYGNYPSSSNNPTGASSGSVCVYRGGSWDNDPANVRSAVRYGGDPANRDSLMGFRLVLPR